MTTIAFDGRIVAADTRATLGNTVMAGNPIRKLLPITIDNGTKKPFRYVYAFCGTLPFFPVVVQWHAAGGDPSRNPFPFDDGSSLIVIDATKPDRPKMVEYNTTGRGHPLNLAPPFAFGSGVDPALTTMRLGYDAIAAVEQSIMLDSGSGPPIEAFDIKKWVWLRKARPNPANAADLIASFKHGLKQGIIQATAPTQEHVKEAHRTTEDAVSQGGRRRRHDGR